MLLAKFLGTRSPLFSVSDLFLYAVYTWSSFSICVKRLHDLGMSGLWFLVLFVPAVGQIMFLLLLGRMRGIRGGNRFGPEPLKLDGN